MRSREDEILSLKYALMRKRQQGETNDGISEGLRKRLWVLENGYEGPSRL